MDPNQLNELKRVLRCPVCFQTYDRDAHRPYFLRCQKHTVCLSCIINIAHEDMIECPICRKFTFFPSADYASWLTEDMRALEFVDMFGNVMESDDEEGLEQEEGGGPNPPALDEVAVDVAIEVEELQQQEEYVILDIQSPAANQVDETGHSSDTPVTEETMEGPRRSNQATHSLTEEAETSTAPRYQWMNDDNEAGPSGYRRPNPARTSAARNDLPTPKGGTPRYHPAPSGRMRADQEEAGPSGYVAPRQNPVPLTPRGGTPRYHPAPSGRMRDDQEEAGPSGYVAPRQNPAPRDVGGGELDPSGFGFRRQNTTPRNVDGGGNVDGGAPGFQHWRPNPTPQYGHEYEPGTPRGGNGGFSQVPSDRWWDGQDEAGPSGYVAPSRNQATRNVDGGELDPSRFGFRRQNPAQRNVDVSDGVRRPNPSPGYAHGDEPGTRRGGHRGFPPMPSNQSRDGQEPGASRYERRSSNPSRPNGGGSDPAERRNNSGNFTESVANEVASRMGSRRASNGKGGKATGPKPILKDLFLCPEAALLNYPEITLWEALKNSGLGLRKNVSFTPGTSFRDVEHVILSQYSALRDPPQNFYVCGRTQGGGRGLAILSHGAPDADGLKMLPQFLFIVPMQIDLHWEQRERTVKCLTCNQEIPLSEMHSHRQHCRRPPPQYDYGGARRRRRGGDGDGDGDDHGNGTEAAVI